MNEHIQPVMAGILNTFAALPQTAGAAPSRAAPSGAPLKCRVHISGADMHETFVGLYPSTWDALDAGMARAGGQRCAVSAVRVAQ